MVLRVLSMGVGGTHPLSPNLLWPCGFRVTARVLDKKSRARQYLNSRGLNRLSGEGPWLLIRIEVEGGLGLCTGREEADTGLGLLTRVTGPGAI